MGVSRKYLEQTAFLFLFAMVLVSGNAFAQQAELEYRDKASEAKARGDYDGAIADYTKAIELNPNEAGNYNNRANAYMEKKITISPGLTRE